MVVKSEIKRIRSLQQKKYRNQYGQFFVEGEKTVRELLKSNVRPYKIYANGVVNMDIPTHVFEQISMSDLKQMSNLKNPNGVLGVFHIPEARALDFEDWVVALDDVRDPGNLGTIIRLCDWFGIHNLMCSQNTVDCYNPKVLQATMGSISRVNIAYVDLREFLKDVRVPIYGAFMNSDSVYSTNLPSKGIIILGNEANGISPEIQKLVSQKITIPQFGNQSAESLNVATATAILLNEIRRS